MPETIRVSWENVDNDKLHKLVNTKIEVATEIVLNESKIISDSLKRQKQESDDISFLTGTNGGEESELEEVIFIASVGGYTIDVTPSGNRLVVRGAKEPWATQPEVDRIDTLVDVIVERTNTTCSKPNYDTEYPLYLKCELRVKDDEVLNCYKSL